MDMSHNIEILRDNNSKTIAVMVFFAGTFDALGLHDTLAVTLFNAELGIHLRPDAVQQCFHLQNGKPNGLLQTIPHFLQQSPKFFPTLGGGAEYFIVSSLS